MEKIIKKAIEGGYVRKNGSFSLPMKLNDEFDIWEYDHNAIVLDPLFWQALGKACGWNPYATRVENTAQYSSQPEWLSQAHRFYAKNLTEGWDKAVEYLEDLIK